MNGIIYPDHDEPNTYDLVEELERPTLITSGKAGEVMRLAAQDIRAYREAVQAILDIRPSPTLSPVDRLAHLILNAETIFGLAVSLTGISTGLKRK